MDLEKGLKRVPALILALGVIGAGVAWRIGGWSYAGAFLLGAIGAWLNFRLIEHFVGKLLGAIAAGNAAPPRSPALRQFIRFALFVIGASVILRLSGFNVFVALLGFLVCPAAVMLEMLFQILTYGHS